MRPEWLGPSQWLLRFRGRISDHLFQHAKISEVALTSSTSQPTPRLRTIPVEALYQFDDLFLLQQLEMFAEIPVCQAAELLEIGKQQSLRPR
jgi:hypothetical protein